MTTNDEPSIVDHVLRHTHAAGELLRVLSVGGNAQNALLRADLGIRLATLEAIVTQNALLAEFVMDRRNQTEGAYSNDNGTGLADRQIELAMGASPEVLTNMLGATERRLEAEQRETARLRERLAKYEPPPVDPPTDERKP